MTDIRTKIPWSHRGLFHWFTGCWHYLGRRTAIVPGHGIVEDRKRQADVNQCCGCGQEWRRPVDTDTRTNPIGTKEQRKRWRDELQQSPDRDVWSHDMLRALDGLDIAEEKLYAALAAKVSAVLCDICYEEDGCPFGCECHCHEWIRKADDKAEDALAEWDKWKGKP